MVRASLRETLTLEERFDTHNSVNPHNLRQDRLTGMRPVQSCVPVVRTALRLAFSALCALS